MYNCDTSIVLEIVGIFLALLGFFCTGDLCYTYFRNKYNNDLLIKTIEKGTLPKIYVPDNKLVPRETVVKQLEKIFRPDKDQSFYYVVCGERGTGKTTLIIKASREVGRGVIYVDIPSDVKDFGKAFGKALNFSFEKRISFYKSIDTKIEQCE
ncbi:hypothetical protein Glove_457g43 [Diversispora epigaea]|uniref:ATPase domain-containing protein n=1 Tax=Diversispora epigaea TaxID=1348612 RepID=A0A397GP05_9GLOM|nr:hypothetical protein Glove_457g43 [Diversispora epigaea]